MNLRVLSNLSLAMFLVFCSAGFRLPGRHTAHAVKAPAVSKGTWGGDHILLTVNDRGAEVELDCAHGEITEPMKLDRKGNFDLAGTFAPEHGGPIMRDETSNAAKARYTGHSDGKTMTLILVLESEKLGPYTLTYNRQSNLMKCR
jgi:hypothetical protein